MATARQEEQNALTFGSVSLMLLAMFATFMWLPLAMSAAACSNAPDNATCERHINVAALLASAPPIPLALTAVVVSWTRHGRSHPHAGRPMGYAACAIVLALSVGWSWVGWVIDNASSIS